MNQEKHLTGEVKKYKRLTTILAVIAVVLTALLIISLFRVQNAVTDQKEVMEQQEDLKWELDSILLEYEEIKARYGDLNDQLTEKDSAIIAQANEITKLINTQADYRKIKKKLELLQTQGKEYVRLLDSLYVVNEKLTVENKEVKQENVRLVQEKSQLSQEKEELQDQVEVAAKLSAYNVSLKAISLKSGGKKEVETDKLRRVDKLKVNFTLSENKITNPGEMNLYCRISLPDGRVLTPGTSDAYTFTNQEKVLQYTAKKTINYDNKSQSVNMQWDLIEDDSAIPGEYKVQIFTDTDLIGESILILKK